MEKPTLLFYCQHSLGMGHLVRSFRLAEALRQEFRTVFVNGGLLPDAPAPANGSLRPGVDQADSGFSGHAEHPPREALCPGARKISRSAPANSRLTSYPLMVAC